MFFFVYSGSFQSLPLVAAFKSGFSDLVGGVSLSLVTIGLRAVVFCLRACLNFFCLVLAFWSNVIPSGGLLLLMKFTLFQKKKKKKKKTSG